MQKSQVFSRLRITQAESECEAKGFYHCSVMGGCRSKVDGNLFTNLSVEDFVSVQFCFSAKIFFY